MPILIRAAVVAATLASVAGRADALTVRDVIELARAGLGEDTLLALVDIEPAVITVTGDDLRAMKAAGVSERVMIALLRHGRTELLPSEIREERDFSRELALRAVLPPLALPQVIVIERREPEIVHVQVPVYVPIAVPVRARERSEETESEKVEPTKTEPVFWGWGGKQRPDSWKLPK